MLGVFRLHEPGTAQEASSLLGEYGFEAAVYAGGTELLLLMKEGLVHYPHLVNIKTVPGLDEVRLDKEKNALHIGPLVTHWELERSPVVKEHLPLLAEVEATIGNVRVRAAGTIGGNLCFAEPHSDPATLLMALGGSLELTQAEGSREVPVDGFFVDLFETIRQDDEILTGISVPLPPPNTGGGYEKFTTHERPTASVAAQVRMTDGVVEEAQIAVGSVGPVPIRVADAEEMLRGAEADEAVIEAVAEKASKAADPVDDLYGSADYKRHLVRVLAARALRTATVRAQGERDGR